MQVQDKKSSDNLSNKSSSDPISASGRITRVSEKFAYIKSSKHGGIFVPPSAVLPKDVQVNPDLTTHLKSGDIVHFTAIPQKGKNDCAYLATKVTISRSLPLGLGPQGPAKTGLGAGPEFPPGLSLPVVETSSQSQENVQSNSTESFDFEENTSILTDQFGLIASVSETFGYIFCEDFQATVFFPGSAYRQLPGEPNRLNAVFQPNDLVTFTARPQPEMSGCSWIAESVEKIPLCDQSFDNQLSDFLPQNFDFDPESKPKPVFGSGQILNLSPVYGFIQSEAMGNVFFSSLAFVGEGLEGACDTLLEVLKNGDEVFFNAIPQNQNNGSLWRATKVVSALNQRDQSTQTFLAGKLFPGKQKQKSSRIGIAPEKASNSTKRCQTLITDEELLIRAVKSDENLLRSCREKFPALMRFVEKSA